MEIKLINTQKVLSPTQISIADYVINPYRGCEFNCLYCYSRLNKNIRGKDAQKSLGVKINAPQCLEKELKYTRPSRILIGSTTECFPSQELKYKITGQILEILNKNNIPYTILTKSHLIKEYLPLISQNRKNKIYLTINFAGDKIIRLFEEKSPLLKQRLETVKEILKNNISLRIHLGPFIPGISCFKEILKILPAGITEIDVELYHHKMGNFKAILHKVEKHINAETANKISKVYLNKLNYSGFAENLEETIKNTCRKNGCNFKVYYIVPDFNEFYKPTLNYENELV